MDRALENILPNAVPQIREIEGYVDATEPLRDEGPFGDHTGYYTLPEPYPVFLTLGFVSIGKTCPNRSDLCSIYDRRD